MTDMASRGGVRERAHRTRWRRGPKFAPIGHGERNRADPPRPWEHEMDQSPVHGRSPDGDVEVLAAVAASDLVTMGVGALMALQGVDRWTATTALNRAADRFQVPVSAVAHAVLTLVAGTREQIEGRAGSAAAQLLVEGLTSAP